MTQDNDNEPDDGDDELESFLQSGTDRGIDIEQDEELTDRQKRIREEIENSVDYMYFDDILMRDVNKSTITAPKNGPCDRCEETHSNRIQLSIDNDYIRYVCTTCCDEILADIDNYHWGNRFTRGHYNVIAAFLRSLDEIWCVKDHAYRGGEMWVHTGYASSQVVADATEFFGHIGAFGVEKPSDDTWDCLEEHGKCFEIRLDFHDIPPRIIPAYKLAQYYVTSSYYEVDYVDSKLFSK